VTRDRFAAGRLGMTGPLCRGTLLNDESVFEIAGSNGDGNGCGAATAGGEDASANTR